MLRWAADESSHDSGTVDFTHVVHSAAPAEKQLDHIPLSERFDVRRFDIWNGQRTPVEGLQAGDPALIVTEVAFGTERAVENEELYCYENIEFRGGTQYQSRGSTVNRVARRYR